MNFLKRIFGSKTVAISSYADFWAWFENNNQVFYNVVKGHHNIEKEFLNKIGPKLEALKDGYFYMAGMSDENTAELVLTADGIAKNIVFVEELVNAAPKMQGWKITAHKHPVDIKTMSIMMGNYEISSENLHFYSNELPAYPDEIDITIIHDDINEQNEEQIGNGIYVFLDNYLGELDFLMNIDNLKIIGKQHIEKELVPISKLKDFLIWRQKEFIEKYEGIRYNTQDDTYTILQAELESGNKSLAVVNSEILKWDSKASHPWISIIRFNYDGSKNNGMPNETDYKLLKSIEEEMLQKLKDRDGCLNVGRQTAESERAVYFACNDFRIPSKVFYEIQQKYASRYEIEFDIFKDKYWQSYERFLTN